MHVSDASSTEEVEGVPHTDQIEHVLLWLNFLRHFLTVDLDTFLMELFKKCKRTYILYIVFHQKENVNICANKCVQFNTK